MSTLLEQASLVLIPSGYKEDTVYSVIPSNGSGDMSFTRASDGTRINSAGLVEVVAWNLLQNSETIGISPWANSNLTITANSVIAPNGTTTADVLTETTATTSQFRTQQSSPQSTNIYTISVYVKNITGTRQAYIDLGPVTGFFNFATETTYSASAIASFENVGNGWYRFSLTTATAITPSTIYMGLGQSNSETYTGNGTSAIAFWGAQLNIGSTAKPYFPTTDRLNVPRLTYQNGGGGCPSLLLEKQSTNLLSYSEQFNNAYWEVGSAASVTANTTTSPDGTQNADTLTANGSGQLYVRVNAYLGTAQTCSNSLFVKKANNRYVGFRNSGTVSYHDVFDFDTKTWTNNSGAVLSYDELPNGWFRLKSVNTDTVNLNYYWSVIPAVNTSGAENATASNLSVYIWGGQAELSSYPTSYIPTTSASATRIADVCSKTGISSLIGQTEGTMFVDFNVSDLASQTNDPVIFSFNSSNYIEIFADGRVNYYDGSGNVDINLPSYGLTNGRHKFGIAYNTNDVAFYIDGSLAGTDTSCTPSAKSNLYLGFTNLSFLPKLRYNSVQLYKTRLSNSELAQLTTI